MNSHEQRRFAAHLLPAVLAAGRLEMGYFITGCETETKADRSPVTVADRLAEECIVARVREAFPGLAIIAEEAHAAGDRPPLTEPFLLVDALDGTKQFLSGFREFTINIAVVAQGVPVFGLIYAPALGDFMVTQGEGVALRARVEPDAAITALDEIGLRSIGVRSSSAGLTAVQSRSRNGDVIARYLQAFPVGEVHKLGSSYKFCLIACGEADIYPQLGDTKEWDTGAGEAILRAAGGDMVDLDGQQVRYGKSSADFLNPAFVASSRPLAQLKAPTG